MNQIQKAVFKAIQKLREEDRIKNDPDYCDKVLGRRLCEAVEKLHQEFTNAKTKETRIKSFYAKHGIDPNDPENWNPEINNDKRFEEDVFNEQETKEEKKT